VNTGPGPVDVSTYRAVNGVGIEIPFVGILPVGGYQSNGIPDFILDGGQIELFDGAMPVDHVAYGDEGGAPTPPAAPGFSCGRSPNGIDTNDDARDWNLDPTATLGAANDHVSAALGTDVVLNELGIIPGTFRAAVERFEIFNPRANGVDLDNYRVTDGRVFITLTGGITTNGFRVFADANSELAFQETGVLYLFNANGNRIDQLGVHGASLTSSDESFQRVPDGGVGFGGPHDGYDYVTSGGSFLFVIKPITFGGTNGPGPATAAPEAVPNTTWGRVKALFR
jgi:hypothetical protein